jgi:hypothetical protein
MSNAVTDEVPDLADPTGKPLAPRLRVVNTDGRGFKTQVYIDDRDVSDCFSNVTVNAGVTGAVRVELEALVCEVCVDSADNLMQVTMPGDATHDLLVRYGWTPPAEPVTLPATSVRKVDDSTTLDPGLFASSRGRNKLLVEDELFTTGEPTTGRELLDRFFEQVQHNWEPSEGDTLQVARVDSFDGTPVPGLRRYTLSLTLDTGDDDAADVEP